MRFPFLRVVTWLVAVWVTASSLHAQSLPQLENDFRNIFSLQPPAKWPPKGPGIDIDPRVPTSNQWSNGTAFGGWQTTRILSLDGSTVLAGSLTGTAGETSVRYPAFTPLDAEGTPIPGAGVQLRSSVIGRAIVGREPTVFFGDIIPRPSIDQDGVPVDPSTTYLPQPENAADGLFYYSPHARAVFATQPGVVSVTWRFRDPAHLPQTLTMQYTVSASPAPGREAKRMFWTEKGFNGPVVNVPEGPVAAVNVRYNTQFPSQVTAEFDSPYDVPGDVGAQLPPERRTLWYSQSDRSLHAYNAEGRVFVEFLGAEDRTTGVRQYLGNEVVEVIREVNPAKVDIFVGDRILPHDNDATLTGMAVSGVGGVKPFVHLHAVPSKNEVQYYAVRTTTPTVPAGQPTGEVVFFWMRRGALDLLWPRYYDTYVCTWPENRDAYTTYVRQSAADGDASSTGIVLDSSNNSALVFQDDPSGQHAAILNGNLFYTNVTAADPDGYALIRHSNGETIWFERIYSLLDSEFIGYNETLSAVVGQRIEPPSDNEPLVGYIRQTAGTAFDPTAYKDPFVVGFEAAKNGAIIPVNARPGNDTLEVWWYKKNRPTGNGLKASLFPVLVQNYVIRWPENPDKIVMASNLGSGELPVAQANGRIYYQNDSTKPGFNPNDEHALLLSGCVYALRDDLGSEQTSLPYVLLRYTASDSRPAMRVFQVQREDLENGVAFQYDVTAGRVLQAPMPLPLLPTVYRSKDTPANREVQPALEDIPANTDTPQHYRRFTFTDRKGTPWIYRGPHVDGSESPIFEMKYYYPSQEGFFIPNVDEQPLPGTPMPYLRAVTDDGGYIGSATGIDSEPLSIGFRAHWPENAPVLQLGETLTLPTRGLPAVRSQTSVEVLYDQAVAQNADSKSATLFDPTVAKKSSLEDAGLSKLPASISTSGYQGKTFFPNLPPHLVNRLYFDPNTGAKGSLVLLGEFKDEVLGEDYLLLNVLNKKDVEDIKTLCLVTDADKSKWDEVVDGLAVTLNVMVENAEKQGSFVRAADFDEAKTAKIWTRIAAIKWNEANVSVPTAGALRTSASLGNGDDVNVAIQWIEDHFADLKEWKIKVAAAAISDRDLATLKSGFSTSDSPKKPLQPTKKTGKAGNTASYRNEVAAYERKLAEYQRRLAVHNAFTAWIFSTDRQWSTAGKSITEAAFQAVDFPTVADTAADKSSAWKFIATRRKELEKWDAGRISPTTLEVIANGLKKDYEVAEQAASIEVGATELAEVTRLETPVDSYALTAAGGGEGWVVLMSGNSVTLTPSEEPVSINILRVSNPLGRGELKVIQPSNPLSEKLTLQHSLDFAGDPDAYEFEWRTLPPVDGNPPAVYNFTSQTVVGDATWTATRRNGVTYTLGLPGQVTVNTGNTTGVEKLSNTFTLDAVPFRAFVSLGLGELDGARVYVNGVEVARKRVKNGKDTPTVIPPLPAFNPLPFVYEVPTSVLRSGAAGNTIELWPETTADQGSSTRINARLEVMSETDNSASWITVSALPHEAPGDKPGSVQGRNRYVVEGNSLFTLTDNYFICRYRARSTDHAAYNSNGGWSKWTDPQLAEGWIKRALAGINPFEQRVKDLYNNDVNLDVSLITQAGKRWEGDVALNLQNISDFGLIEIYETILRRGRGLSIEGAPPIKYGPANDALLLAAGYLNDLYMLLGNEAYADASNPTIAFSTDNGQFGDVATSLFAFKGQLATVLDEELALLRGRDDFLTPGSRVSPVFNRLVWNYTRGIDSGEAVYALNYNIKDLDGDGVVGAADAAKAFPQGHGDAYGHYLTALTNYYGLLWNSNFDWTPRTEAVLVLGKPVAVDYVDERKFASAAAAWTRTAAQTVELTYRAAYNPAAETKPTWEHLSDGRVNSRTGQTRRWGVDDWAVRGGQGAFFHWLTGNSTLPAEDPDPSHEGIQKIDRTTVPELAEIVAQNDAIQKALDTADARLNPLGLSGGAVPFDISPAEVDAGKTHFEQVYSRATEALKNAVLAFNNAKSSTQILRGQEDSLAKARDAIKAQERAYTAQLVDLYGTPYPEDIGPGKTYVQGYDGPDLVNFMYVETPELFSDFTENGEDGEPFVLSLEQEFKENDPSHPIFNKDKAEVFLSPAGEFIKPDQFTGRRVHPGRIQTAISELLAARVNLRHTFEDCAGFEEEMRRLLKLYESAVTAHNQSIERAEDDFKIITGLKASIGLLETVVSTLELSDKSADDIVEAITEAFPKTVGMANDVTSGARAAVKTESAIGGFISNYGGFIAELGIRGLSFGIETREALTGIVLEDIAWSAENAQWIYDLKSAFQEMEDTGRAVDKALRAYDQAERNLRTLTAEGRRIQDERQVFRQKSAALIQGYRTKDFGFRAFRNEALESYKSLFDLASRYTYLAAKAYDYETGLVDASGNATANTFLQKIVSARAVGVFNNGVPQPAGSSGGDPGLSGALARMQSDWAVAKSRFGFNNPDRYRTTFSLRREKERIVSGANGDPAWKDFLASSRMDNILDDPDVRRYCMNVNPAGSLTVQGFVISFDSTIATGYNFFGKPLAGGDSGFSPTSFATKIRSTGIAFPGYVGMNSPTSISGSLSGTGAQSPSDPVTSFNDPSALSATPYIYVIPTGVDSMRTPSSTDSNNVRTWRIEDQAIPMPFDIGGAFSGSQVLTGNASLTEPFTIRKHQAFRAVPDGAVFSTASGFTNSRLIGRSVWNSRWKIVIPGHTLMSNPVNGMKTFEETVKDILIHFETYSYSGN